MTTGQSKADYLKKYLAGGSDDAKKKKKKDKKIKAKHAGLQIFEDDAFLSIDAAKEKVVSSDEEEEEIRILEESKTKVETVKSLFKNTFSSVGGSIKPEPEDSDDDEEVARKPRQRHDSDNSPPRSRKRHDSDNDQSPVRKRQRHDSDSSPVRRPAQSRDKSPIIKSEKRDRHNTDRSTSPKKSKRLDSDADQSPVRRRTRHDSDESPPRRRIQPDKDQSPPRRRQRHDSDQSPPRASRKRNDSDDQSPPRRRQRHDSDQSPPRERRRSPDQSPPRKRRNSPDVKDLRSRRVASPEMIKETSTSKGRMEKTLDGKIAGLQNARDLKEETRKLMEREAKMFAEMDASTSGRGAEAIVRNKQIKKGKAEDKEKKEREAAKTKELEEKYKQWNRGAHQLQARHEQLQEMARVAAEPMARSADDVEMNRHLKEVLHEQDPMAAILSQKKREDAIDSGDLVYPTYQKAFPPNRFGIRPGYRWDGVDRSNGFEGKLAVAGNKKRAQEAEYYQNIAMFE